MILYTAHTGGLQDTKQANTHGWQRMILLTADSNYFKDLPQGRRVMADMRNVKVHLTEEGANVYDKLARYQPYALVSYHYYKSFNFAERVPKMFPNGAPILFADSGAFSAATQGVELKIDDYAKWIVKNLDQFHTYANFDVIGDEKQTAKNQAYLEKEYGLKPLPVFHVGADFKILDKLMSKYDYIALGGLVPFSGDRQALMKYFITCFKMAAQTGAKFHGFGMTNWQLLKSFPWHSVDSSSWNRGVMFGQLSFFEAKIGDFVKCQLWDRKSVYKEARRFRELGFDPECFIDKEKYQRSYACALDGISWALASLWLTNYWQQDMTVYLVNAGNGLKDSQVATDAIANKGAITK
jgi:hypothetical protein